MLLEDAAWALTPLGVDGADTDVVAEAEEDWPLSPPEFTADTL
jgi:hypothetical protein